MRRGWSKCSAERECNAERDNEHHHFQDKKIILCIYICMYKVIIFTKNFEFGVVTAGVVSSDRMRNFDVLFRSSTRATIRINLIY